MKNVENILLFCPQKDTVCVGFHPEVVWRAKEEGREDSEESKEVG